MNSFPRDILFFILLQLPAEYLWTVARHVCVAWADIIADIDFVNAHYLKSKDGLLVQEYTEPYYMVQYLEVENRIFRPVTMESNFACLGVPNNSCRGLCIFIAAAIFNNKSTLILHVANPMTRQVLALPYLGQVRYKFFKLLYIDQTMDYVAVCLLKNRTGFSLFALSLGTDEIWRRFSYIPEKTLEAMSILSIDSDKDGVLHSTQKNRATVAAVGGSIYVLQDVSTIAIINVLEETVSYIEFPHGSIVKTFGIQVKGDYITCMGNQEDDINVWMLKGSEWLHVCRIDDDFVITELSSHHSVPIGWLGNDLIFAEKNHLLFWVYDFKNTDERFYTFTKEYFWHNSMIHRNSLIRW